MSEVTFEELTPELARELAPLVRERDALEIRRSHGFTPLQALEHARAFPGSSSYLARSSGDLLACCGLAPLPTPGQASPWMLVLQGAEKHRLDLLRAGRQVLNAWNASYPVLFQMVEAEHHESCRFLRALGFELLPPVAYGPEGALFHPAIRRQ